MKQRAYVSSLGQVPKPVSFLALLLLIHGHLPPRITCTAPWLGHGASYPRTEVEVGDRPLPK